MYREPSSDPASCVLRRSWGTTSKTAEEVGSCQAKWRIPGSGGSAQRCNTHLWAHPHLASATGTVHASLRFSRRKIWRIWATSCEGSRARPEREGAACSCLKPRYVCACVCVCVCVCASNTLRTAAAGLTASLQTVCARQPLMRLSRFPLGTAESGPWY